MTRVLGAQLRHVGADQLVTPHAADQQLVVEPRDHAARVRPSPGGPAAGASVSGSGTDAEHARP